MYKSKKKKGNFKQRQMFILYTNVKKLLTVCKENVREFVCIFLLEPHLFARGVKEEIKVTKGNKKFVTYENAKVFRCNIELI